MHSMDELYMRRCFELASHGLGNTRTNPIVGAVIVYDNRIIGEGYHHEYGGPHAEVNAIRSVKDKSLLEHATIYINLEPCSHFGKTPPCSTLIMNHKIPRVVISNTDPFPSVSGRGIEALKNGGTEVITGVLEEEGEFLNRRFLTFHRYKRPYVILKWAETADGFIDAVRKAGDPIGVRWITGEVARTLVHKWRSEEAGLMVGTNTIIADNPRLNVRRWFGNSPLRIAFDRNGRVPETANILDGSQDTIVFTCDQEKYSGKTNSVLIDHESRIEDVLTELYDLKILSILVEGGQKLHNSFISSGCWDEARVFRGSGKFEKGVRAPYIKQDPAETLYFEDSELNIFYNNLLIR
ncbi:MAG: bifunctional diaminohydroxyphosphoribosylaminopyrimidine deaminase/5-amino-6-(5-phosphoribosylamino)uracil reductase RibD [Bacteroidales bacterium]|nr:bifunctional diaminohydroxyphosphoribosylaminopyrimidine deaminase/5-amino-6-(5-phosphoribosylamino)uracil reductase RibD [Bacteroidales bacterium]